MAILAFARYFRSDDVGWCIVGGVAVAKGLARTRSQNTFIALNGPLWGTGLRQVREVGDELRLAAGGEADELDADARARSVFTVYAGPLYQPVIDATITALEERLDPKRFIRVHRSFILNLDRLPDTMAVLGGGIIGGGGRPHIRNRAKTFANAGLAATIEIRRYVGGDVGEPTLEDIVGELSKPGRDPRAGKW